MPCCRISGPAAAISRSITNGSRSIRISRSRLGPRAEPGVNYDFDWGVLWRYREALASGFVVTLALSLIGLAGAMALGLTAGTASARGGRAARSVAAAYVEVARNVPLLVHMYFWYLGLTALRLPAFWCGVLALAIYSGAYIAEIVR